MFIRRFVIITVNCFFLKASIIFFFRSGVSEPHILNHPLLTVLHGAIDWRWPQGECLIALQAKCMRTRNTLVDAHAGTL